MFSDRITVPTTLRFKVLKMLHRGHPGITRMKALARSYVYWPQLDNDSTDIIKRCSSCAAAAKQPVKVELQSWPKATEPFQRIHIDYAGPYMGDKFLVVDAFSKYPEILRMSSTTSTATIKAL